MSDDRVNIEISQDLIKPIMETKINAAIVEALGERQSLIDTVVCRVLDTKVDESGKQSGYNSRDRYTLVQWKCKAAIEDAIRRACDEYLSGSATELRKAIVEHLGRKKHRDSLAKSLVEGLVDSMKNHWRMTVKVEIPEQ